MNKNILTDCFTKGCQNKTYALYCLECLSAMVTRGETTYFIGL